VELIEAQQLLTTRTVDSFGREDLYQHLHAPETPHNLSHLPAVSHQEDQTLRVSRPRRATRTGSRTASAYRDVPRSRGPDGSLRLDRRTYGRYGPTRKPVPR
jgi:hypothetical protein